MGLIKITTKNRKEDKEILILIIMENTEEGKVGTKKTNYRNNERYDNGNGNGNWNNRKDMS